MPRKQNLPELPPVESFTVAPHRYLYNAPCDRDGKTWREVRDSAPYKVGEVVLVICGDTYARAYVHSVSAERNYHDELHETYEVRRETKKGRFALRTYKAFPGFVQRGYQRAGQAPEMPQKGLLL